MKKSKISLELARKIALHTQLLDDATKLPRGKEGVSQTIEKLGYVQIDTINVIERAHHHTLWTRRSDYNAEMLHELQAKDRRVFEYWGHAMSYLPMTEYRYHLPRMRNFENHQSKWIQHRFETYGHYMNPVLERIRKEGPLSSKDFAAPPDRKGGTWWDWKPAKVALELLFWKGELMITARRKFQKIYDLTERVLPTYIDKSVPNDDELGQFFVRRALTAYGVAQEREIRIFMQPETARDSHINSANKDVISTSLADLVDTGEAIPVTIEGDKNNTYYALSKTIEMAAKLKEMSSNVYLLSPFDNLIIQRDRIKRLFAFDYALECYVPPAKRKYGYFVLPILWGEHFVGRLDPKADRKTRTLIIRNLVFEPDFDAFDEFLPCFTQKLKHFAHFNQCKKIKIEKMTPTKYKNSFEIIKIF